MTDNFYTNHANSINALEGIFREKDQQLYEVIYHLEAQILELAAEVEGKKLEPVSKVRTYSLAADGDNKLSDNFKVREFRCKDNSDEIKIDIELVIALQKIREWAKAPVTITSAYRTLSYNRAVGGADGSQHVEGKAADIKVSGKTPAEVANYALGLGVRGIIKYDGFVHIDTRESEYHAINKGGAFLKVDKF